MLPNEKIAIIFDTNIFRPGDKKVFDLTELNLNEYYKLKKTLELNELENNVELFFPEIVLLELIEHNKKHLNARINELENLKTIFKNFSEIKMDNMKIDIDEYGDSLKEKYIKELNIIPTPKNKEKLFNEIFSMALHKDPPFLNESKNDSDKGFKDVIIFLSIVEFSENSDFNNYVLVSNDNGFNKNMLELKTKFKSKFNNKNMLEIINKNELNNYLFNKFSLFKEFMENFYHDFEDEIDQKYEKNKYIIIDNEKNIIRDYTIDSTEINQIEENKIEVNRLILIEINCRSDNCYFGNFEITIQKEKYIIIKEENDNWKIDLEKRTYTLTN